MSMTKDQFLNDFAIRCFSEIADGDYLAARMASRARLIVQYLWSSQQAVEKYLKCILLLNRLPAKHGHDLGSALGTINASGKLALNLTKPTQKFIEYLDQCGQCRYFEISNEASAAGIVTLDRAVWELRRFCTLDPAPGKLALRKGEIAPKFSLLGRHLEKVLDDPKNPARQALLWQNGFFGRRRRRSVKVDTWWKAQNSPLFLNPQYLEDVLEFVTLPKTLQALYRNHKRP